MLGLTLSAWLGAQSIEKRWLGNFDETYCFTEMILHSNNAENFSMIFEDGLLMKKELFFETLLFVNGIRKIAPQKITPQKIVPLENYASENCPPENHPL